MRAYLHDKRGWGALGYELIEVTDDRRRSDVVVYLLEAGEMDRKYGKYEHLNRYVHYRSWIETDSH